MGCHLLYMYSGDVSLQIGQPTALSKNSARHNGHKVRLLGLWQGAALRAEDTFNPKRPNDRFGLKIILRYETWVRTGESNI